MIELKKNKLKKYETEEQMEVKRFIYVLLGLIFIIVGIYFFTRAFVTKDLFKETKEINYTTGTINYDTAIVGTMLNRPESEYYVVAFSMKDTDAIYYNTIASKYKNGKEALKVYYLDLDNELNKKYISEDENISTSYKTIDELKLGSITLLRIKNGKVTKYITNIEEIKKEFGI